MNEPAFPHTKMVGHKDYAGGMSLRDYFAAQALALMFPEANALLASQMDEPDLDGLFAQTARYSYRMADAMLAARKSEVVGCPSDERDRK